MGTLFSDGFGAHPKWRILRRADCAVAQVDDFGNDMSAACGPVPHDLCLMQVSRDGEDNAIAMLAQIAIPRSDCRFRGGRAEGCDRQRQRAPLGPPFRGLCKGNVEPKPMRLTKTSTLGAPPLGRKVEMTTPIGLPNSGPSYTHGGARRSKLIPRVVRS